MKKPNLAAIILAAGQSTRMRSKISKMLHPLCGRPIIRYVTDLVKSLGVQRTIMVVGYQAEKIQQELAGEEIEFVHQKEQKGTAHAVLQAQSLLADFRGQVIILNGDVPLLTDLDLSRLIDYHSKAEAAVTILSSQVPQPFGYGRILRNAQGHILGIVEEKDASEEQRKIQEINTGTYCFDYPQLVTGLPKINNQNAKGEYYLTDIISIFSQQGAVVQALKLEDFRSTLGINTREDLAEINRIMRQRILRTFMLAGVTMIDPVNTYIDFTVKIGRDTVISPGVVIEGHTSIGEECFIGPFSRIVDSTLEDGVYLDGGCFLQGESLAAGVRVAALQRIGSF